METTGKLSRSERLRRVFYKLDSPYWVMIALYAILVTAALILDSPQNIVRGLWTIFTSRSILVTDYAALAGMGAMLVSSVLVGTFSLVTMIVGRVKASGGIIMGLWLILGFAFFGKNLANTIPLVLGVWLFAKYKKMPFKDVAVTSMMCASVAPIVSEVAYLTSSVQVGGVYLLQPWGAIVGLLVGMLVGFIFVPLAAAMGKVHGGYLLYNAGFVGGVIAAFATSILRNAGFEIAALRIWAYDYTVPLGILMYIISFFFIALGLIMGGTEKWEKMKKLNKHTGRLLTDYYALYGDVIYINMGILSLIGTTWTLAVGAPINGATMGGIFCIVGFGALGKNLKNVIPIMIGCTLGGLWSVNPVTSPSTILAILFGTGVAPLAGKFGLWWGILCGFIHLNLVSFVGLLNGGLNLYNNGFAGGFMVVFMMPIMMALSRKGKEELE